jgi:hypothetical protein
MSNAANFLYSTTNHGSEQVQVGILWVTIRDIPQELAVSFMHQLQISSNILFNHYHLACLLPVPPGLAYHHHHLAFSQASESDSYYASELEDLSP